MKNLFLCDGAPFASNADKNPTLTIMALSWRAADYLVDRGEERKPVSHVKTTATSRPRERDLASTPASRCTGRARPGLPPRAIQWVMAAVAASALPADVFGLPVGRTPTPQEHAATQPRDRPRRATAPTRT